ncbi:hypothetical protein ERIC1_1c19940 [Paenibacillus larvae subsp. larvae DSM 25719]|uniref:Uncharacterized protein n=1 Tax=Paenibacillus larvae subsp. larvae DSM 25430 TaxID=697284 RepID=V9W383_9BACL|nr:hypothetical protein ERIC2_c07720 [Paenibacillus larvae subsp. larvae DSM 25430]ETK28525.1 hypothetical protein ERIC1_1c19940 [Paenibacillus larvae subsp. larvae DSM 25719]
MKSRTNFSPDGNLSYEIDSIDLIYEIFTRKMMELSFTEKGRNAILEIYEN